MLNEEKYRGHKLGGLDKESSKLRISFEGFE
jgi:hypothetical protein